MELQNLNKCLEDDNLALSFGVPIIKADEEK
jgi:hypothetical protein